MDANFKLKQKERGFMDPPLANGFAYMVSNRKLLEHLADCKDSKILKDEVILCLLVCRPQSLTKFRPSPAARTSTPSTMLILSTLVATLLWVSEASTVPAMGSSN